MGTTCCRAYKYETDQTHGMWGEMCKPQPSRGTFSPGQMPQPPGESLPLAQESLWVASLAHQ